MVSKMNARKLKKKVTVRSSSITEGTPDEGS